MRTNLSQANARIESGKTGSGWETPRQISSDLMNILLTKSKISHIGSLHSFFIKA